MSRPSFDPGRGLRPDSYEWAPPPAVQIGAAITASILAAAFIGVAAVAGGIVRLVRRG